MIQKDQKMKALKHPNAEYFDSDNPDSGIFDIDLDADEELQEKQKRDQARVKKQKSLKRLKVEINGDMFDADKNGISNMTSVGTISNWQYNKQINEYLLGIKNPPKEILAFSKIMNNVFNTLYVDTKLEWKNVDGEMITLSIDQVLTGLYIAMQKKSDILHESAERKGKGNGKGMKK